MKLIKRLSSAIVGLLLLAGCATPGVDSYRAEAPALLLPLLLLPSAWALRGDFVRCSPGLAFNELLFRTFRLELWFAALLSAGAMLGRAVA